MRICMELIIDGQVTDFTGWYDRPYIEDVKTMFPDWTDYGELDLTGGYWLEFDQEDTDYVTTVMIFKDDDYDDDFSYVEYTDKWEEGITNE